MKSDAAEKRSSDRHQRTWNRGEAWHWFRNLAQRRDLSQKTPHEIGVSQFNPACCAEFLQRYFSEVRWTWPSLRCSRWRQKLVDGQPEWQRAQDSHRISGLNWVARGDRVSQSTRIHRRKYPHRICWYKWGAWHNRVCRYFAGSDWISRDQWSYRIARLNWVCRLFDSDGILRLKVATCAVDSHRRYLLLASL